MSNQPFKTCGVAILVFCMACAFARAIDESVAVKMSDVPVEVRKAIRAQAGKSKLDRIGKVTYKGKITYEVEIGRGSRDRSFTLDENGELLSLEIALAETPPAVRESIKKIVGTGTVDDVAKVFDEGEVSYDVDITRDGKERSFTLDEKGKLTEIQILPAELPAPIQKTIAKELAGGQLGDINKEFDDDGITYVVEINPDAKARTITINESGAVVSDETEIALAETPEAIQKALKDLLKDGELGGITKNTEQSVVNYEVNIKRGGKWKNTTVGSDGKIVQ